MLDTDENIVDHRTGYWGNIITLLLTLLPEQWTISIKGEFMLLTLLLIRVTFNV